MSYRTDIAIKAQFGALAVLAQVPLLVYIGFSEKKQSFFYILLLFAIIIFAVELYMFKINHSNLITMEKKH